jgi:hypothetical protein
MGGFELQRTRRDSNAFSLNLRKPRKNMFQMNMMTKKRARDSYPV